MGCRPSNQRQESGEKQIVFVSVIAMVIITITISHASDVAVVCVAVVVAVVVVSSDVVVVVVGVWLSRVREMGGLADASQCRDIAENGLGGTLIRQIHGYTGCSSPAITNVVTIRILIRKSESCVYTNACPSPQLLIIIILIIIIIFIRNHVGWNLYRQQKTDRLP